MGQPMLQFVKANDWGIWEFFTLVGFREQAFPGVEGRLRPALPVRDAAIYESDAGDQHIDYALRWSHYFGPLDIGISHFSGTARDPVFLPEYDGGVPVALVPYYSQMNRTGLSAQATLDAWLLKLEATSTEEKYSRRSNAAVTGFEYTLFGIAGSGTDLGLVVEYQYDDERGPRDVIAQNDGVLGLRWVLNDLDGTEVLLLAAHDFDYNHEFFSLELGRRLSENWKLELEAVALTEGDPGAPDSAFRQDDYLKLEVKRYY